MLAYITPTEPLVSQPHALPLMSTNRRYVSVSTVVCEGPMSGKLYTRFAGTPNGLRVELAGSDSTG